MLERPNQLADKEYFSESEAAEYATTEKYLERQRARLGEDEVLTTGEINEIWRREACCRVGGRR